MRKETQRLFEIGEQLLILYFQFCFVFHTIISMAFSADNIEDKAEGFAKIFSFRTNLFHVKDHQMSLNLG